MKVPKEYYDEIFNYLGQWDQPVFTSVEDTGEACIAKGAIMDGETAMTKFSLVFI